MNVAFIDTSPLVYGHDGDRTKKHSSSVPSLTWLFEKHLLERCECETHSVDALPNSLIRMIP